MRPVGRERSLIRVGLDGHVIGRRRTGNETYAIALATGLAARPDVDLTVYLDSVEAWPSEVVPKPRLRPLRSRRPQLRIPLELPLRASLDGLDILHCQYVIPPFSRVPIVVSIHDLSFEDYPEDFAPATRRRLRLTVARAARTAAAVVTPSTFSRNRLLARYDIDPDRVVVVPPAVVPASASTPATDAAIDGLDLPDPYVLAVGDLHPRKNIERLVRAISIVRQGGIEMGLVVAGQRGWQAEAVDATVREVGAEPWVRRLGYVDRPTLGQLYRRASMLAYVSLYEGFGLPVAEAMARGTPVLAADAASIPEVAGDAAVLVDPRSDSAVAAGIAAIASDASLRERLRGAGLDRAVAFRPEAFAGAMIGAYRTALEGRGRAISMPSAALAGEPEHGD
jgi:glycosyltransferase involved in cell wall biosynthesis